METRNPDRQRSRAIWMVLAGIASVQVGSAIGKDTFDSVSPTALTWLRLAASAIIILLWARPRLRGHTRVDWAFAVAFGAILAFMNWAFYQAIAQIPIGVAVTIEFIGPLSVAAFGSRRPRDLIWVLLAAVGVSLLGLSPADLTWAGVGFALLAGAAWAAYIPLSVHTGRRWEGWDGLAVASVVGALFLTPFAIGTGGEGLLDPHVLLVGAAIGLLSSALPYGLELSALRTLEPRLFGILMSIEPAAAALAAALILGEVLSPFNCWRWAASSSPASAPPARSRPWPSAATDSLPSATRHADEEGPNVGNSLDAPRRTSLVWLGCETGPVICIRVIRSRAAIAVLLLIPLAACIKDAQPKAPPVAEPSIAVTATPEPTETATEGSNRPEVIGTIAQGLKVPWGIDFLPDGTAIVTERDTTRVLAIDEAGTIKTIGRLDDASPQGEAGLLGVAVSPDFATDQTLFFYFSTATDNRIERATYDGTVLSEPEPILENIPNGFIHDGGRLAFGPDGFLYVSTGETGNEDIAQDRGNLGGKILRITKNGDPAPGNPDPDSEVWSYGHRNVQGSGLR